MKSYTDISQSKKLAEILPLDSADMHYSKDFDGRWFVDLAEYTSVKIPKYVSNIEEHLLPCWSLAALLKIIGHYTLQTAAKDKKVFIVSEENYPICSDDYSEPVDACVTMIEKLNELNLL